MRKYLVALTLVLFFATGAMAYQNNERCGPRHGQRNFMRRNMENVSPKIRAKHDEVRKLHYELRDELAKTSPNKTKARQLHKKIQKLNHEISDVYFEENLKNPDAFRRGSSRYNVTEEERAKFEEMRKVRDEMAEEYRKDTPDETKLRSLQKRLNTLREEHSDMRFEERLKNPSNYGSGERHRRFKR